MDHMAGEKFEIVHIKNPFDPARTESEQVEFEPGKPLLSYLDSMTGKMVVIEGKILTDDELATFIPKPGSQIAIRPRIGRGFLRIFLQINIMIAAVVASVFIGPWAGLLIAAVGNLLVNLLLPPPKPNFDNAKETPTYSWTGAQLTARQGLVIAKGYGVFQEAGNVIGSYLTTVANNQYLSILISYGHGPCASISNILINGNLAESYTGISIEKRLGYPDQDAISFFHDSINDYPQNTRITAAGGPVTISGHRNDTDAIEVEVSFPNGLYFTDSKTGKVLALSVAWKIEVRLNAGAWLTQITPRTGTLVDQNQFWVAVANDQFSGGPGNIIAYATSTSPTAHFEGELFSTTLTGLIVFDHTDTIDGTITTRPVIGHWTINPNRRDIPGVSPGSRPVVVPATWTSATKVTTGTNPQPYKDSLRIDGLTRGTYDVRITKLGWSKNPNTAVPFGAVNVQGGDLDSTTGRDEIWVVSVKEISHDVNNYNGEILLGINVIATNQLSGGSLNITAKIDHGVPPTAGYKNLVAVDRPQFFYRFGDPVSATQCFDSSGRASHGTYVGPVVLGKKTLIKKSPSTSCLFDGTSATSVTPPAPVTFSFGVSFSIDVWIRPTAFGGDLFVNASIGDGLKIHSDGRVKLFHASADHFSNLSVVLNQVNHVAVWCDGGDIEFIVNGVVDFPGYAGFGGFTLDTIMRNFPGRAQAFCVCSPANRRQAMVQRWNMGTSNINIIENYGGANQALVALDILTNYEYGMGRPFSEVDEIALAKWASFNDEAVSDGKGGTITRNAFCGVFDSQTTAWDQLLKVGQSSRCVIAKNGIRYTFILDAPGSPVQMFNMGNIIKGTFREIWLASTDRANWIDMVIQDEDNNYQRTPLTYMLDADIGAGKAVKKSPQVDMFGITNQMRALRMAQFLILGNQTNLRTVEWGAFAEAIHCQIGDVVTIAHDVPKWGNSGRFISVAGASVKLDQKVAITNDGVTVYSLAARLDAVQRASGTISSIDNDVIFLTGYSGDTTVKRLVIVDGAGNTLFDAKAINYGSNWIQVEDPTGLANGQSYIAYDTNVIDTKTIVISGDLSSGQTSNTDTLTLAAAFQVDPNAQGVWIFGSTVVGKQFRILSIDRRQDLEFTLTAAEYNAALYSDTDPALSPIRSGYTIYGPLTPSSGSDDASVGTRAWVNPNNAVVADLQYATVQNSASSTNEDSHWLKVIYPAPRMAPTDVPQGIEVDILWKATVSPGGSVVDKTVKLIIGGAIVGNNKAIGLPFSAIPATTKYGGPVDLWGTTPLPSDCNDTTFGVAIQATMVTAAAQPVSIASIDVVNFIFTVSKAAAAAVQNLVGTENSRLVGGVYQPYVDLAWKNGPTTFGVDVFVSLNGQPEQWLQRLFGVSRFSIDVQPGQTVTLRVVGFDAQNNSAPYNTAPIFSDTVVGVATNLIKNSSFQGSFAWWSINPNSAIGDAISRTASEDGYSIYTTGGTDTLANAPWVQEIMTGWAVGDWQMYSGYIRVPSGITAGNIALEINYQVPTGSQVAISTAVRASNVVTVTCSAAHGLNAGDWCVTVNITDVSMQMHYVQVATRVSATVFTFLQAGINSSSGGGTVQKLVQTTSRVAYNLTTPTDGNLTSWKRIFTGPVQVPTGTTQMNINVRFYDSGGGMSIPAGKAIHVGHLLLETTTAGATAPSVWADIDALGHIVATFRNGTTSSQQGQGNTVPVVTGAFDSITTTTTIQVFWTNIKILWPSQAVTLIPDNSVTITGLSTNTAFTLYPYYDIVLSGGLLFVASGNNGTPPYCFNGLNKDASVYVNGDGRVNLGPLSGAAFTTTSSGTGGGSGGGFGGGDLGCPRASTQKVRKSSAGIIGVGELAQGEWISSPEGIPLEGCEGLWTQVQRVALIECWTFVKHEFKDGHFIENSEDTKIPLADGRIERALDIKPSDLLLGKTKYLALKRIEVVELDEPEYKVVLTCLPTPLFFCGSEDDHAVVHNFRVNK